MSEFEQDEQRADGLQIDMVSPSGDGEAPSSNGGMTRIESLAASADDVGDDASDGRRRIGQSTVMIIWVAVVAAGGLYLMRLSQGAVDPVAISPEIEAMVDVAIARDQSGEAGAGGSGKLTGLFDDTDAIIAMFTSDSAGRQVPLEYVKMNPFLLPVYAPEPTLTAEKAPTAAVTNKRQKDELTQWQMNVSLLKVELVIEGARPMAMINGQMLKPGDRIEGFKVDKIANRAVQLKRGEHRFEIAME